MFKFELINIHEFGNTYTTNISEDFVGSTVTERFIRHFKFYHKEE